MKDKFNKQFNIDAVGVKSFEDDAGNTYIEGYANTIDKDRGGDVVLEQAWLGAMKHFQNNPILLAYHDHSKPIGTVTDWKVDSKGLYVKAKISDTAKQIKGLIKEGILKAFSIGFTVEDAEYRPETDTFYIKALELLEVSVVSVGMNQNSLFSVSKSIESKEDLEEFKQLYSKKEVNMTEEEKLAAAQKAKALENAGAFDIEGAFKNLTEALLKAQTPAPAAPATVSDNTEKLLSDIEKRFEERLEKQNQDSKSVLDGLHSELKEKADELAAMQRSKMSFTASQGDNISRQEKENAIIAAKILNKDIKDTKYGKELLIKAGSTGNDHIPSTDWENEFQTNAVDDIRKRLVVEPLFRRIMMNTYNLYIPINPDPASSEVTWVQRAAFGTANSGGAAQTQALTDTTLTAYKVATKEYLMDEEEEDSILAVAGIIRDAIVRRMAKGVDKALLVGVGNGTTDPITGISKIATTAGGVQVTTQSGTLAATDKVTVAKLATVRRGLGEWGLNPQDVVYIVSNEAYFDLLDDTDFRTVDLVGNSNATILTGQIGYANGSPIIVSGEFNAKGADVPYVVCVNKANFIVGELRGMKLERDRNIEEQRSVLVASRRIGFIDIISGAGTSVLTYPSA